MTRKIPPYRRDRPIGRTADGKDVFAAPGFSQHFEAIEGGADAALILDKGFGFVYGFAPRAPETAGKTAPQISPRAAAEATTFVAQRATRHGHAMTAPRATLSASLIIRSRT